jgi:type IV secretion system protein VirB1
MLDMIMACAPNVAPSTIQEIIRVESAGNPLAININQRNGVTLKPTIKIRTVQEAIAVSHAAIAYGHTVDMGYMQVNSANLPRLGYTVEDMFDPCRNIAAGARILESAYAQSLPRFQNEQAALRAALSIYNTGNHTSGFRNGYVGKYLSPKVIQK